MAAHSVRQHIADEGTTLVTCPQCDFKATISTWNVSTVRCPCGFSAQADPFPGFHCPACGRADVDFHDESTAEMTVTEKGEPGAKHPIVAGVFNLPESPGSCPIH